MKNEEKLSMVTENHINYSPWGYLIRIDTAAPVTELRGKSMPIPLGKKIAFHLDCDEAGKPTLCITSFPCWVYTYLVKKGKMKIKFGVVITVKIKKKIGVFKLIKININESFLNGEYLHENYIIGRTLGEGGFGHVYTLNEKESGYRCALKVQQWPKRNAHLEREAQKLLQLKHPHIIETYDIMYSTASIHIYMEYMKGGDLSQFVNFQGSQLLEKETKVIFYQIVKAVGFLHSVNICHRDLKPANILLWRPDPYTLIKVSHINSVLSEVMHKANSCCDSEAFLSPEVSSGRRKLCDKKADVWSMGVILYLSLSGNLPEFSGDTLKFTGSASLWTNTSVMKLLQGMLCKQPLRRLDTCMVDQHPWLKDKTMQNEILNLMRCSGNGTILTP